MFVMDVEKFILDGNFKLGKKNFGWDLKVVFKFKCNILKYMYELVCRLFR